MVIVNRVQKQHHMLRDFLNYVCLYWHASISSGITYYELVDTTRRGVDAQRFAEFLKRLSLFVPSGFGVIVMDNASPDLNPIEFVFGLLKKRMQSYEYSMDNLIKITRQVLDDMTVNDIRPYIFHCAKAWFHNE